MGPEHACCCAALEDNQRRLLTSPHINARFWDGVDQIVDDGICVTPRCKRAALILNPVPRNETALAEMHGRLADILERCACPFLPGLWIDAVVLLGDDTALLQLVKQESTVGRNVAVACVLAQQFEASTLEATVFCIRC